MKAVILAGGKGERLAEISGGVPKPMMPLCGKPALLRQTEVLKCEGISDFIIVVGYKADKIKEYFGSGSDFGVNVTYFEEDEPLGTGGALPLLGINDDILLCSGDLLFDFSLERMAAFHKEKNALVTLFAHPSSHPGDSTAIVTDPDGRVKGFAPKESRELNRNLSNAGIQILSREFISSIKGEGKLDLDRDIISPAVGKGGVYAYRCTEYVHDIGTPERFARAENDIKLGIPEMRSLRNKQKAVFLDRDGTINVYKGYISKPEDIELIPGAAEAINIIHDKGYLAVLITNQAVIARGECTFEELDEIHARLEELLGEKGAYLDAVYFCPHHPDSGFPGERPEYKIKCSCRKPSPGMILSAVKDLNIDLDTSVMAGDAMCDVQTAKNAGCKSALLACGKQEKEKEGVADYPDLISFAKSL